MDRHDFATQYALMATSRLRRILGDRSLDRSTLMAEIDRRINARIEILLARQNTVFTNGLRVYDHEGSLTARGHLPAYPHQSNKMIISMAPILPSIGFKSPFNSIWQRLRIKLFGRQSFIEDRVCEIFDKLAHFEARMVADKICEAPAGWAAATERGELQIAANEAPDSLSGPARI